MPTYVMMMRYHSDGFKAFKEDPERIRELHDALTRWEAKILFSYHMMGRLGSVHDLRSAGQFQSLSGNPGPGVRRYR